MNKEDAMTEPRPIYVIAEEIHKLWRDKNQQTQLYPQGTGYAALPYYRAMLSLVGPNDMYGEDTAKSVVTYFLSNATSWRGEDARRIKAELKQIFGLK
jgi:hypothetical protein